LPRSGKCTAFPEAGNVTLRRDTIVTALALLAIAVAIPFAVRDTIETAEGSRS
jgi:hypothetical protein